MAKATVAALQDLRRPEDVARIRGKTISEVLPLPAIVPTEEPEPEAAAAAAVAPPVEEAAPATEVVEEPAAVEEAPAEEAPAEEASAEETPAEEPAAEAPAEPEAKPKRRVLRRKKDDS
jgi:hypothetical protein